MVNRALWLQHGNLRATPIDLVTVAGTAGKALPINQDTDQTERAATQVVVNQSLSIGKDACRTDGFLNLGEMKLAVSEFLYDGEC